MDKKRQQLESWHIRIAFYIGLVKNTISKPYISEKEKKNIIEMGENIVNESFFHDF